MALDRHSIEKKDFPLGTHGYDPQAVDTHLSGLADEVEDFKTSSRRRSERLAQQASDQVRAIIEAAETSAADIQRDAETEAREIREEAYHEAQATREQAADQVRDHVSQVAQATSSMQSRLEGMESELVGLIESLRSGSSRLDGDLRQLEAELGHVRHAAIPESRPEFQPEQPEPQPASAETYDPGWDPAAESVSPTENGAGEAHPVAEPPPEPWGAPPADPHGAPGGEPGQPQEEAPAAPLGEASSGAYGAAPSESFGAPEPGSAAEGSALLPSDAEESSTLHPPVESDDSEGARLIALNMALNGTPREETARYLADNFQLADRDRLLDEVYASVEG